MTDDKSGLAPGGETKPDDDEALLDHCAQECMDAIERKDKKAFVESLNVLIADLLNRMGSSEDEPQPKGE